MQYKKIKGKKNYLYDSLEEFHKYVGDVAVRNNWRDGEEGEWILTDDMYVCQLLKSFKVGKSDCVRTVCGTFRLANEKRKMLGSDGIAEYIYSFSGKYNKTEKRADNSRHFLFAKYVARGDDVIDAFKKAYPDAKSESYIKQESAKLLKRENVQKMVKEEIREILDEEGVTPKYIIQGYKQVCDVSERDTDKLRSLDSLAKISGLFDTQEKKTEELTVFAGFSPEQLETIKDKKGLKDGKRSKTQLLGKVRRETEKIQEDQ
tara:strand:- start:528 stop:1310 length:783 start_codon:yes stop_codon:yes gene_type:complete